MRMEVGVNKVYIQAEITDYASRGARRSLPNRLKIVRRDLAEINNSIRKMEMLEGETHSKPVCPYCQGTYIIKWGRYCRKVRYYFSKSKKIRVQRYRCRVCRRTFSILPPSVKRFRRIASKALRDLVDTKLTFGNGNRNVARFTGNVSHTTIWHELQVLGALCREALKAFFPYFSGIGCIDDMWVKKRKHRFFYICALVDAITERVVWLNVYSTKSDDADTKLNTYIQILVEAKKLLTIKAIVTDGDPVLCSAISLVLPDIPHQLCVRHITQNVWKKLSSPCKHLPLSKDAKNTIHDFLSMFNMQTKEDALAKLGYYYEHRKNFEYKFQKICEDLWAKKEHLFCYLPTQKEMKEGKLPMIPRTNNAVEHVFSGMNAIKKLCRSYKTAEGLENVMFALALKWNFEVKYASKDGLSPNQRSGINIKVSMYEYVGYPPGG